VGEGWSGEWEERVRERERGEEGSEREELNERESG
jgi:hypothetical protein